MHHSEKRWICSQTNFLVATVTIDEPNYEAWTHNARLIAAAPELLEVLQTIENDGKQVPAWLWDRIQAAVFKATGESKGNANISPNAGPCTGLVAESSDGPANSSKGKVEQKRTPGEPQIGSGDATRILRKLDGGKPGPRPLKDP
jgi:hypothetical protein